jgi:Holliday junction resolvasome RuvABC endonuclease subunit
MAKILVAGLDGSLRNFGVALMWLDTKTLELSVKDLVLVKTEKSQTKQVRKSSDNLARAKILVDGVSETMKGVTAAFLEVPSGGQSYDAVLGFGIVIGIYAGIKPAICEVSPSETKMAAVGTKTASKQEMIDWAFERFPEAPWRMRTSKGAKVPTLDNEHLADAVAIVCAGIETPAFKQTLAFLNAASV